MAITTTPLLVLVAASTAPAPVKDVAEYVCDGVADQTEINNALSDIATTGGLVQLTPGTFTLNGTITPSASSAMLRGSGPGTKLVSSGVDMFDLDTAFMEQLEIDHMTLDATGGHVFAGTRIARCHFHHLEIFCRTSSKSVLSSPSTVLMIENRFEHIQYHVYGATRSVPAWDIAHSGVDLVTENLWNNLVCWNEDSDATQYQFKVVCTHASSASRNNVWRNVVFEKACGGAIRVESATGTLIDNCFSWDTTANTVLQDIFWVGKNASGIAPTNTVIRNSGRVGDGPNTGVQDINIDANASQTLISMPSARGTGVGLRINLNGGAGTQLQSVPSNATLSGQTTASYSGEQHFVRKTADETVNNSATLQDDDHLTVPVVASGRYIIEGMLIYDSATAADYKIQFVGPTGATLDWSPQGQPIGATGTSGDVLLSRLDITQTASLGGAGVGTKLVVPFYGFLIVSTTAGSLKIQWAQDTANATNTTTFTNSFLAARRVA